MWHLFVYAHKDWLAQMSVCGSLVARNADVVAYYHPNAEECCIKCHRLRDKVVERAKKPKQAQQPE
jgi:hypothetical protein